MPEYNSKTPVFVHESVLGLPDNKFERWAKAIGKHNIRHLKTVHICSLFLGHSSELQVTGTFELGRHLVVNMSVPGGLAYQDNVARVNKMVAEVCKKYNEHSTAEYWDGSLLVFLAEAFFRNGGTMDMMQHAWYLARTDPGLENVTITFRGPHTTSS